MNFPDVINAIVTINVTIFDENASIIGNLKLSSRVFAHNYHIEHPSPLILKEKKYTQI